MYLKKDDLSISPYVNGTGKGIRVTHMPTDTTISCHAFSEQVDNQNAAAIVLARKINKPLFQPERV